MTLVSGLAPGGLQGTIASPHFHLPNLRQLPPIGKLSLDHTRKGILGKEGPLRSESSITKLTTDSTTQA